MSKEIHVEIVKKKVHFNCFNYFNCTSFVLNVICDMIFFVFKVVLSACSTYFDKIFSEHEEKDPVVILKDVKFVDIKALVEFMYKGEINVENVSLTVIG